MYSAGRWGGGSGYQLQAEDDLGDLAVVHRRAVVGAVRVAELERDGAAARGRGLARDAAQALGAVVGVRALEMQGSEAERVLRRKKGKFVERRPLSTRYERHRPCEPTATGPDRPVGGLKIELN